MAHDRHWTEIEREEGLARIAASVTARPFADQDLYTQRNVQAWSQRLVAGFLPVRLCRHLLTCLTHTGQFKPVLRWDDLGQNATTRGDVGELVDACMAAIRNGGKP